MLKNGPSVVKRQHDVQGGIAPKGSCELDDDRAPFRIRGRLVPKGTIMEVEALSLRLALIAPYFRW
jgi:hypothetical protein